jgi:hypothetical protein
MKAYVPQVQPEIGVLEGQLAEVIGRVLAVGSRSGTLEGEGGGEGESRSRSGGEGGGGGEGDSEGESENDGGLKMLLAAIPQDFIFSRDPRVRDLLQGLIIKIGGIPQQGSLKERWGAFAKKLKQSSISTALVCRKSIV